MNEDVLQYICQTQSFNQENLQTTDQQELQLFSPGKLNTGGGADFSDARIKLDGLLWSGDVEIHTYASHWLQHNHHKDPKYDRVVLHVVWQEDQQIHRRDGTTIPTLVLKEYLSEDWYGRYQHLLNSLALVPCETYLSHVDSLAVTDSIEQALIERLEAKAAEVLDILAGQKGDWERASLIWLFTGFGFKKNKAAFQQLAQCLDLSVLRKLQSATEVEAYLFGMSGLLPATATDEYVINLISEFNWQDKKYGVKAKAMVAVWWQFMRMRPANFPTLRLAQLATFLYLNRSFLRTMLEAEPDRLMTIFQMGQHEFWQQHYHFRAKARRKITGMGSESQNSLLINVVAPVLVAYGQAAGQPAYVAKAVQLLETLKPEVNRITRAWTNLGIEPQNAAESQGLLGLFNDFCKKSRCLSCSIGKNILQPI